MLLRGISYRLDFRMKGDFTSGSFKQRCKFNLFFADQKTDSGTVEFRKPRESGFQVTDKAKQFW